MLFFLRPAGFFRAAAPLFFFAALAPADFLAFFFATVFSPFFRCPARRPSPPGDEELARPLLRRGFPEDGDRRLPVAAAEAKDVRVQREVGVVVPVADEHGVVEPPGREPGVGAR